MYNWWGNCLCKGFLHKQTDKYISTSISFVYLTRGYDYTRRRWYEFNKTHIKKIIQNIIFVVTSVPNLDIPFMSSNKRSSQSEANRRYTIWYCSFYNGFVSYTRQTTTTSMFTICTYYDSIASLPAYSWLWPPQRNDCHQWRGQEFALDNHTYTHTNTYIYI